MKYHDPCLIAANNTYLTTNEDLIEEKAARLRVPVIRYANRWDKSENEPNPVMGVCGECGLEVRKTMHYSCPYLKCPVFRKGTL